MKQWHKYKCVVKIIDFLVAYSFQTEMSDKFINLNMLNELFNYVRADFGVVLASDEQQQQMIDQNTIASSSSEAGTTNTRKILI